MPLPSTAVPRPIVERQITATEVPARNEDYSAGVSWAAVIGGAFVAASLSLILLALGTGLGFSSISPWSNMQTAAATLSKAAIAWLIITQILASAMGGYLAGRLRTKWVQVHTDEVYFRDTAHGLLVWALGMVVTAAFLTSAATSLMGGATQRNTATPNATESAMLNPNAYFVDTLFRPNTSAPSSTVPVRTDAADRSRGRAHFELMPCGKEQFLRRIRVIWRRWWPLERPSARMMLTNACPMSSQKRSSLLTPRGKHSRICRYGCLWHC